RYGVRIHGRSRLAAHALHRVQVRIVGETGDLEGALQARGFGADAVNRAQVGDRLSGADVARGSPCEEVPLLLLPYSVSPASKLVTPVEIASTLGLAHTDPPPPTGVVEAVP